MIPISDFLKKIIWPLDKISEPLPKKGLIYDLGCGEGIIAKYLADSSKARKVIGVDSDKNRLPNIRVKNLQFIEGDIRRFSIKKTDGVVISDVLHHLDLSDQKRLLTNIATSLKKSGILVIKEIDSGEYLRSKLSRLWDFLLYPKDRIFYWNGKDLDGFLKKLGFRVKIIRSSRFFPGSTTLFICKKV